MELINFSIRCFIVFFSRASFTSEVLKNAAGLGVSLRICWKLKYSVYKNLKASTSNNRESYFKNNSYLNESWLSCKGHIYHLIELQQPKKIAFAWFDDLFCDNCYILQNFCSFFYFLIFLNNLKQYFYQLKTAKQIFVLETS